MTVTAPGSRPAKPRSHAATPSTALAAAAAILLAAGSPSRCAASPDSAKPAIALMPLRPLSGITAKETESFTDRLRGELVNTGAFTVLEREMMAQILQEQEFQQTDVCDESSCITQVGQLLAVNKMVGGAVGKVGNTYSINVKVVDVQTGVVDRQITLNVKSSKRDLIAYHAKNVAREIAGLAPAKKSVMGPVVMIGVPVLAAGLVVTGVILVRNWLNGLGGGSGDRTLIVEGRVQ